uniref:PDZ domain-containing protein n=1 Tax=Bodo saltans TaxID=75058 RepID=B6DTN6_BODSA|nr:hypothetical protein [Bodo saltans]
MDAMSNCLVTMLMMVLSFVGEVKAELAKPGPGSPQRHQHSTSTSQEKHHDNDDEVSTSYKSVADSIINDFTNATKDQRAEHAVVATGQVEAILRSLFPFLLRCVRSSVDMNSGVSVGCRSGEASLSPRSHSFSAQQQQHLNSPITQETTAAPVVGALGLLSDLQVRSILENIEYDRRVKTIMRCYHDLLQKFAHQARADQLATLQQLRQPQKQHHVSDVLAAEDQLDTTLSPVMWHDDEHTTDQRGGSSQHYDQQQRTTAATTFTVASNEEYSIPPRLKREESAVALQQSSVIHQKGSQGASQGISPQQPHQQTLQQQPQYRHNNSAIGGGDVNYDVDLPVASSADVSLESIGATHHHIHHSTSEFHRHRLEPDNDNNDDDEDVSSLSGSSSGAQDKDDTLLPSAATTQRPGARGSQTQLSPRSRARTELQHATNTHHRHGVAEDDDNEHRSASSASVSRRSVAASSSFIAAVPQQLHPLREVSFGFDVAEYQEVVQENPIMEIDTLRIITLHLGSPADRCRALRVGDRLIKIGAQAVSCLADMDSAAFAVSLQPPGTPVSVHFIRRKVPLIATFVPEPSTVHPPSRHLLRPADLITSSARAAGSSPVRLPVRRDLLGTYQLPSPSPPRQHGGGHSSPPTNQNNSSSSFVQTTSPARIHTISFSSPAAASTTTAQQDRVHSAELYARDRGTLDAVMDTSRQHVLYHSGSMVNRLQETLGRLESLKKRREDVALEKDLHHHHHSRRGSGGVVGGRTSSSAGNSRSTTPKSYRSGGAADVSVHSDDSWAAAAVPNDRELSTSSSARVPRHLRASEHVYHSGSGLRGIGSSPSSRRSSPDARSARTLSPQNNRIWR